MREKTSKGPVKSIWSSPSNNNEPIWRGVSGEIMMRTPRVDCVGQGQSTMAGYGGNARLPSDSAKPAAGGRDTRVSCGTVARCRGTVAGLRLGQRAYRQERRATALRT